MMVRIFFAWAAGTCALVLGLPLAVGIWSYDDGSSYEPPSKAMPVRLYRSADGDVLTLDLEEYVAGVVSAEMPAEFPLEALKAQAVAARTYAAHNMTKFGGQGVNHGTADVSDDPAVSQAWVGTATLKQRWGNKYEQYEQKIRQAVRETNGRIICYENRPISALFHAASAGRTASAEEIWGSSGYPYLQSVAAPEDSDDERVVRTKRIAADALLSSLGEDAVEVSSPAELSLEILSRTASGRVEKLRVKDKIISGDTARSLWGLRSTNFSVAYENGEIVFTTYGYGHGVGMSQYGAAKLAEDGKSYEEITGYFYRGTKIKKLQDLD